MADKQPEKVKVNPLQAAVQKVLDGLVDGATSIIEHGAGEAGAALYSGSGSGYVMYGHGVTAPLELTSLDQLDAQAEQLAKDVATRQMDEPEQSQGASL